MFSKLILRNSKRNRKENGLFFSSLIVPIIAFYIILSLSHQDVMRFLAKMESDAVDKLMGMIPIFYGTALVILFFLIYYASKFQLEKRRHEFGVYLMMGMRRLKLFGMLFAEDLRNNLILLAIGIPAAVLLSELTSLITARLVGIGIIGHHISFSFSAVCWTAIGFLMIKFASFLILSGKIAQEEIGSLLAETPDNAKQQKPAWLYAASAVIGICCLAVAYGIVIRGGAWYYYKQMLLAVLLGLCGTFAFFWGLRFLLGIAAKSHHHHHRLHVFNFRQVQETVFYRSGALAVCALLILAAMCCFGAGVAIARFYGQAGQHVLDYTFVDTENGNDTQAIRKTLADHGLDTSFSQLFDMKLASSFESQNSEPVFEIDVILSALQQMPPSESRKLLLNNLQYEDYPYFISLDSYNEVLRASGKPALNLDDEEAAVYMDGESTYYAELELINQILQNNPQTRLYGKPCYLTGEVQTADLVTDRSITLSFALILPEQVFEAYTQGDYSVYLNGILDKKTTSKGGLITAMDHLNQTLDQTGLFYESYLQNIGRQLFYMVAASYITIYLAIIFLVIANTVISVQFLIGQQKSGKRYQTLIRLGAGYEVLCQAARHQINWYFGIPIAFAAFSSIFGVHSLLSGILASKIQDNIPEMMVVSAAMIFALCVIEWIYITAVKRSSNHYLHTLMVPEREE